MKRFKNIIKSILILGLTVLIFYLLFQKIDYLSLKAVLLGADLLYLCLALGIVLLVPIFSSKKWQLMLAAMDYQISFKESLWIIMGALPFSMTTPSRSGDLIRAYYLKNKIPLSQTIGAVLTERLIDISVLSILSLIGGLFFKNQLFIAMPLFILLLIGLCFWIITKIKLPLNLKWQERINQFLYVSKIFFRKPQKLLPIFFYAIALWLTVILEAKVLFLSLGVNIPFLYVIAAFPLSIFVGLIPITLAGMGTRDSAIIYFFTPLAEANICLGMGVLYSFFGYWLLALLGLPFMKKLLQKS